MRNALSTVPKAAQQMVAATLRTIFAEPDRTGARKTIARIPRVFERRFPTLVAGCVSYRQCFITQGS
jgi:putative transposase